MGLDLGVDLAELDASGPVAVIHQDGFHFDRFVFGDVGIAVLVIDGQANQALGVVENVGIAGVKGEVVDVSDSAQALPCSRLVEVQFAEQCGVCGGKGIEDGFHFRFPFFVATG